LQGKLYDTARQINVAKQTVALKAQTKKRNEMTKIELGKVSPSTPAFKAVGRMYGPVVVLSSTFFFFTSS